LLFGVAYQLPLLQDCIPRELYKSAKGTHVQRCIDLRCNCQPIMIFVSSYITQTSKVSFIAAKVFTTIQFLQYATRTSYMLPIKHYLFATICSQCLGGKSHTQKDLASSDVMVPIMF
jgi:hypothetical protein